MPNLGRISILIDELFCSYVCGDHRHLQTFVEICRNMGICCGIRAVAAREKYPGFMLLHSNDLWQNMKCNTCA